MNREIKIDLSVEDGDEPVGVSVRFDWAETNDGDTTVSEIHKIIHQGEDVTMIVRALYSTSLFTKIRKACGQEDLKNN